MIKGIVRDKYNNPVEGVDIEFKDNSFNSLLFALTDKNGEFLIKEDIKYSFVAVCKEYKEKYLEYWLTNKNCKDCELEIVMDVLEVYGLNAFNVDGAYDSTMIYFRPMSLIKVRNNEPNIAPNIKDIFVTIDGVESKVISTNIVNENIGQELFGRDTLDAYLIQAKKNDGSKCSSWSKIDVKIVDIDGNVGMASLIR